MTMTLKTAKHWSERVMHDYGFRAVSDITPGVDYLWNPWLEADHLRGMPEGRRMFVKVIGSDRGESKLTGEPVVTLTLEMSSGRTFTRSMAPHRHMTVFYPER